jgi:hypothetical protein
MIGGVTHWQWWQLSLLVCVSNRQWLAVVGRPPITVG